MAGRMAHHVFYTAVKDNPCYSGYLWAPFDALLNVARLAQFPQERIWYHSPWGEYVPNRAVSNDGAKEKHPPPATVSSDTPRGYAEKFVPRSTARAHWARGPVHRWVGGYATDCFLEIALPTTLHMILPPRQKIAFVDHWWIWEPPLNTTFVRQKWEEGMEVDSFHTFHWGDKGSDGVWRPHLNSVQDVRELQADSFKRQGMNPV
ncbi:hypothetical protein FRB90_003172 [Tulasnella sp. 427]|nr:hypothetical protein FRB90_003172 [Tulasnella sp. 427]